MHEETYWQAVLTRDKHSDGTFVYAVRSTGIYCNPSCAARRPRREQVVFFPQPEAAEQAGDRPCRRWRHHAASVHQLQLEMLQHACSSMDTERQGPLILAALV